MERADFSSTPQASDLRLPEPKRYLTEAEVCDFLHCTVRAFRLRPADAKPPCIRLSPRKKLYDVAEFHAWVASRPRSK